MKEDYKKCIDCGKCTKKCTFLTKYNINLKDYAEREDLSHSCFLCGECARECPVDIDGREISLRLRSRQDESKIKKEYKLLLLEKRDYIFKNYKNSNSKKVIFMGCNFPAYFPKTTKALSKLMKDKRNISTVYDCCGKPVSELGLEKDGSTIIDNLNKRFIEYGIEEIIVVCPNCYYFLKEKINIKISSVYDELRDMGMLDNIKLDDGILFMPCPDKDKKEILNVISNDKIDIIKDIQCCSAGGLASVKEKELAEGFRNDFKKYKEKKIYTYCATCSRMISKTNNNTEHILSKIIGVCETPEKGVKVLLNKAFV